jgi:fucose permease
LCQLLCSSGPLIPYIQDFYSASYEIVSLLFVGQMCGFLLGAFTNGWLTTRYGIGKVITMGAIVQAFGYVFLVPAFPFPVFPVCYAVIGFGMSLQDAQANTFVATLPNADHRLHLLHASYGLGAVVCPLAATAFASSGIKFSYFYCLSIGLAFVNVAVLAWAFKFSYRIPQDEPAPGGEQPGDIPLRPLGNADDAEKNTPPPSPTVGRASSDAHTVTATAEVPVALPPRRGQLAETLSMAQLWLCTIFTLLYVGAEVSQGGWIVTFVQTERGGGPSAGYVATGFWLGLLLGRATLSVPTVRLGEKWAMFIYLSVALCLEFAVWFADSLVGNAVTVGLIGYAMGPAYPIVITVASRTIPRRLHTTAM